MEYSAGCGCIGIIPALIGFGLALIFGLSFLKAIGIAVFIFGVCALIGLFMDLLTAISR